MTLYNLCLLLQAEATSRNANSTRGAKANYRPPPPNKGNPSATTSRRLTSDSGRQHPCPEKRMFVVTRPALLTHVGSTTLQGKPHAFPELQTWCKLHGGGHKRRVVGHTGSHARGRRKQRKSKVWKRGGSMRVNAQFRLVENAAPAPQPPCDLSIAFSLSDMTESNTSRNLRSTLDETSCCHPNLEHPGPLSYEEEAWSQQPTPDGRPNRQHQSTGQQQRRQPSNKEHQLDCSTKKSSPPPQHDVAGRSWERCPPNLPHMLARWCTLHCATPDHPNSTAKNGAIGRCPIALIKWNPQQSAEAVPKTIVMHLGTPQDFVGRQHAQQIISPRTGAMEQHKPPRLGRSGTLGIRCKKTCCFSKIFCN